MCPRKDDRKRPAMGSPTGFTSDHFRRFLTSHFPSVLMYVSCEGGQH
jgi:hypothetical protein